MTGKFTLLENGKLKWGGVSEDSSNYKENDETFLAVADGITRDSFNIYPNLNTEEGKKKFCDNYPKPSIAKEASNIAVNSNNLYEANKKIMILNKEKVPDPNWLMKDLAGCTAAMAIIKENILHYSYIGCCGIVVIRNGKVIFKTKDEYWPLDKKRWNLVNKAEFIKDFLKSFSKKHEWWSYPEGRMIMRRMFRNKPKQKYSFGVLTGEKEAEYYIRKGKIILKEGDVVLLYTDGLKDGLFTKKALKIIKDKDFSKLKEYCKDRVNTEGTVVYWCK